MQAEEPVPPVSPSPPPTRQHQNGMLGEFIVNKKSPYPNVAHSTQQGGGCGPTLQGEQSRLPPNCCLSATGCHGVWHCAGTEPPMHLLPFTSPPCSGSQYGRDGRDLMDPLVPAPTTGVSAQLSLSIPAAVWIFLLLASPWPPAAQCRGSWAPHAGGSSDLGMAPGLLHLLQQLIPSLSPSGKPIKKKMCKRNERRWNCSLLFKSHLPLFN